jgi:hypothetical protein
MAVLLRRLLVSLALAGSASLILAPPTSAVLGLLELRFSLPPALPPLPSVALNGAPQTVSTAMTPFAIEDTRLLKFGWNVTAQGLLGTGRSPVFAQYCPAAKCGSDAEGYVPGGQSLPPGSLTLNSAGASFGGGGGTAPTLQCATGCQLDSAAPTKIASGVNGLTAPEGNWTTSGLSSTSLSLAVPPTLRALPSGEVYRVDVLWTLSTGP